MRYLLLSVLVIFAIGLFAVEDAFGVEYARVNIQPNTDTQGCEDNNSCYSPHTITIKQFEWVKWKNLDTTIHTITAGYPHDPKDNVYDSGPMNSGSTFEYQFHQKGKYPYFCQIHPWAQGFVIVTAKSSDTPPATSPVQTQTTTSSKTPTILILDPLPSRISFGESLTISGTLTRQFNPVTVQPGIRDATIEMYMTLTLRGETSDVIQTPFKTDINGRFFFQTPPLDVPPEIDEEFTAHITVHYKGNDAFESSKSKTYGVLFTPTTTTSTTTTTCRASS